MRLPSPAARPPTRISPPPLTPPLAVTLGDPAGIGPDITLLSWRARGANDLLPFAVYGAADVLRERARVLGLDVPIVAIRHLGEAPQRFADALPVLQPVARRGAGTPADQDAAIVAAIEAGTTAALTGEALALV